MDIIEKYFSNFEFTNLLGQIDSAWGWVAVVIGLLYCFLGYRFLRFMIALTGFAIAGGAAAVLTGWFTQGQTVPMLIAGVVGGLAGALALLFMYRAGVFCLGLFGGLVLAETVLAGFDGAPWLPLAVIGTGVGAGLLALAVERPMLSMATAVIGASITLYAAIFLLLGDEISRLDGHLRVKGRPDYMLVGAWLLLAAAGSYAQLSRRRRPVFAPDQRLAS